MWSFIKWLWFGEQLPPHRRREEEAWRKAGLLRKYRSNLLSLANFLELVLIEKKVTCQYHPLQRRAVLSIADTGIAYIAIEHFFGLEKLKTVVTVRYVSPLNQDYYCWFQLAFLGLEVRYLPLEAVPLLEYKPELPREL